MSDGSTTSEGPYSQTELKMLQEMFDGIDSDQDKLKWGMEKWKKSGDATYKLFDEHGQRLVKSAPWNERSNLGQQKIYTPRFLVGGIKTIFRSSMIGQPLPKSAQPLARMMSSGGTLFKSIYDACEAHPDNKHVIAAKRDGISGIIDMSEHTPEFFMRWLKHEANLHQDGAAYTPAESLEDVWAAQCAWKAYADENDIKVEKCPPKGEHSYKKLREKHIFADYPRRWAHADELKHTLDARKTFLRYDAYEDVRQFLQEELDVTDKSFNKGKFFEIARDIYERVFSYSDAHSSDTLRSLARTLLRFAGPLIDQSDQGKNQYAQFILKEPKAAGKLLDRLGVKIPGVIACSRNDKTDKKKVPKTTSATKRDQAVFQAILPGANSSRDKATVDDFLLCVFGPLHNLLISDINWEESGLCLSRLCAFLFLGKQDVQQPAKEGKKESSAVAETTKYSVVRSEVAQYTTNMHTAPITKRKRENVAIGLALPDAPALPGSDAALGHAVGDAVASGELTASDELTNLLQDSGWLFALVAFYQENYEKDCDVKYKPCLAKLRDDFLHKLAHKRQSISLQELLNVGAHSFTNLFPESWAAFTNLLVHMAGSIESSAEVDAKISDLSCGIFESLAKVTEFRKLRVVSTLESLKHVAVGEERLTVTDLTSALAQLSDAEVVRAVVPLDLAVRSPAWASLWQSLIDMAHEAEDAKACLRGVGKIRLATDQLMESVATPTGLSDDADTIGNAEEKGVEDGAGGTSAGEAKTEVSINKLRAEWSLADGTSLLALGAFMRAAEAKLAMAYLGERIGQNTLVTRPARPDMGLDKVIHDNGKLYCYTAPDATLTMNFVGKVTRNQTSTSLPLCTIWGESLFVEGSGNKNASPMVLESYVPAWSVPLAGVKPKGVLLLKMEESVVPMDFAYHQGKKKRKISVNLSLFRLVLSDSAAAGGEVFDGRAKVPFARLVEGDRFPKKAPPTKVLTPKGLRLPGGSAEPEPKQPALAHMER